MTDSRPTYHIEFDDTAREARLVRVNTDTDDDEDDDSGV